MKAYLSLLSKLQWAYLLHWKFKSEQEFRFANEKHQMKQPASDSAAFFFTIQPAPKLQG